MMFQFVFLCQRRWFQFNSRIVKTHFASAMTLNNWEIIAQTRSYIFRWLSRCSLLTRLEHETSMLLRILQWKQFHENEINYPCQWCLATASLSVSDRNDQRNVRWLVYTQPAKRHQQNLRKAAKRKMIQNYKRYLLIYATVKSGLCKIWTLTQLYQNARLWLMDDAGQSADVKCHQCVKRIVVLQTFFSDPSVALPPMVTCGPFLESPENFSGPKSRS